MPGPPLELSGLPPNPLCLHCSLAEQVQRHIEAHPERAITQSIGELVELTAEVIASRVPPNATAAVRRFCADLLHEKIEESRAAYARRGLVPGGSDA